MQGSSPESYVCSELIGEHRGEAASCALGRQGCTEVPNTTPVTGLCEAMQVNMTNNPSHGTDLVTVCLSHLTAQNSDFLFILRFLEIWNSAPSLSLICVRLMTQRSQMGHTCLYVSEEKGFKELHYIMGPNPWSQPGSKVCLRPP